MGKKSFFIGWIPVVIVVWVIVFGTYEVIEKTLLKNASQSLLHILHIARGTCTSFLLAGIAAWYVIRKMGIEPPRGNTEEISFDYKPVQALQAELERRLGWLVCLRWVAICSVLLTIGITYGIFKILSLYSVFALGLITVAMIFYNLIFWN